VTRHTDDVPIPDRHRSLDADLDLALRLAAAADAIGMRSFTGAAIDHETKADGSPVSDADREVERSLRAMVASERPDDGFLGEEVGA
jgi:histidinol-phosphatase